MVPYARAENRSEAREGFISGQLLVADLVSGGGIDISLSRPFQRRGFRAMESSLPWCL